MIMLMNTGGVAETNCFLIGDETAKEVVLFDAPDHTTDLLQAEAEKRGFQIVGLWLTHGHFDHFADHVVVTRKFPAAKVLIHEEDAPKLENPGLQTRLFGLPFDIPPRRPDGFVTDGQQLSIGSLQVTVMHTPGHSPGHVAYYFPKEGILVGGDLIIGGSVGRTDLPDSHHRDLEASVRKVMALPETTRLLGGHGRPTTLAHERRTNLFVQEILESA